MPFSCKGSLLAFTMVLALLGCAATARLYDLESGMMLTADYTKGVPHGQLIVRHPDGPCTGEYSTVAGGSWGTIYASGAGASVGAQAMSVPFSQHGAAIAVCPGGRTIECEYVSSVGGGTGYCRDNRGGRYRVMF